MPIKMLVSKLTLSAVVAFAATGWAQDVPPPAPATPPPAPEATTPPPSPPPAAEVSVSTSMTAEAGLPAPGAAPTEAPPAATEEEPLPPAWIRIDSDIASTQLWAGATHDLGGGVGLASDIYVTLPAYGEFDIGPAFTAGPFVITPMLGIQFNWSQKKAWAVVPQLYVVGGPDPVYLELWVQNYLYTPFTDGATNTLYFRAFVDYKFGKYVGIGPQIEPFLELNGDGDTVTSLPVGGNVMLTNYGQGNTLFAFLGYETNEDARQVAQDDGTFEEHGLVGRLTFVKNF